MLLDRNQYIGSLYQEFIDKQDDRGFFRWLIANYLLEGIYFYNWFAFFDTMADHLKMRATQRMVNYIRRDELTHVTLFANILREIKNEFPDMFDENMIYEMFEIAVNQEIGWSNHILWDRIVGINGKNTETYTKYLANQRLILIGLKPLYPDCKENPYKHLDRLQENNMEKWNFFESTVTNYTQSSSMNWNREF